MYSVPNSPTGRLRFDIPPFFLRSSRLEIGPEQSVRLRRGKEAKMREYEEVSMNVTLGVAHGINGQDKIIHKIIHE